MSKLEDKENELKELAKELAIAMEKLELKEIEAQEVAEQREKLAKAVEHVQSRMNACQDQIDYGKELLEEYKGEHKETLATLYFKSKGGSLTDSDFLEFSDLLEIELPEEFCYRDPKAESEPIENVA